LERRITANVVESLAQFIRPELLNLSGRRRHGLVAQEVLENPARDVVGTAELLA
jgi:hypothetical protein